MEGAVVTLVDVTQLKEAEKQSEQTMRDLELLTKSCSSSLIS